MTSANTVTPHKTEMGNSQCKGFILYMRFVYIAYTLLWERNKRTRPRQSVNNRVILKDDWWRGEESGGIRQMREEVPTRVHRSSPATDEQYRLSFTNTNTIQQPKSAKPMQSQYQYNTNQF